jgi:diguanylate cyclase (GGDEF)-like protein
VTVSGSPESGSSLALRRGRVTLGVLVDWLEDDYQNSVLSGIADAATEHDANLVCFAGGVLEAHERFGIQRNVIYDLAGPDNVDGIMILAGTLGNVVGTSELLRFSERYKPLPMCGIAVALPGMPSVLVDNATGMRQALVHLIEHHGHRRIAFIRGPEANEEAERRYRVYREVLEEFGLGLDDALVVVGDFHQESGVHAIERLLDVRGVSFTALVAASDYMALGAIQALSARGLSVPDDISVIGFDDVDEARFATPPLSTVRQPLREQGRRATELLLAQIQGSAVPEREVLHTDFVARGSCRCSSTSFVPPGIESRQVLLEQAEHAVRTQARQRLGVQRWARALAETGEALLTTFDLKSLVEVVAKQFPRLQIHSCFLSLYKVGSEPADRSRLILGYDREREPGPRTASRSFPSRELVPEDLLPTHRRFSYVVEPLFFKEEQLGFGVFEMGPREGVIYEALRDQISGALKGALLVRQVIEKDSERQRLLRYIVDVTPDMHKIQPLADLYQNILGQVTGLISAVEPTSAPLPGGSMPPPAPEAEGFLAIAEEESELSVRAATPRFSGAARVDECLQGEPLELLRRALSDGAIQIGKDATILPLRVGEIAAGIIYLDRPAVSPQDVELLEIFSNQATAAIQNMRLYEMAALDPLTGVHARRFFDQWLKREVKAAFRSAQPLSLLMIDMDNMKLINDTAGHLAGDQALAAMGKVLRQVTRENDVVGRWGGDEFALILPRSGTEAAERAAQRVLDLLGERSVRGPGGELPLRSSVGVSTLDLSAIDLPEPGLRLSASYLRDVAQSLVRSADEALYRAKKLGGARVCLGIATPSQASNTDAPISTREG